MDTKLADNPEFFQRVADHLVKDFGHTRERASELCAKALERLRACKFNLNIVYHDDAKNIAADLNEEIFG